MVFSSIPSYLDPANWQQQQSHQASGSGGVNPPHHHLPPPAPPAAPPSGTQQQPHGSGSMGSIRPGSMAERARMANIPMPEAALKCPRCESANTKFCYFNNYSLSQPRHFCKTCRRYWTRGGALRNVPVGGGCRRNKRSKGKSSANGDRQANTGAASSSTTTSSGGDAGAAEILGLATQIPSGLRFLNPLSNLHDSTEIGLNYGGITTHLGGAGDMNSFHLMGGLVGTSGGGGESSLLYGSDIGQWRLQLQQTQVPPFLGVGGSGSGGGLISQTGSYHLFEDSGEGSGFITGVSQVRPKSNIGPAVTHQTSVKMEADNQEANYSRQLMGLQGNEQYWGTGSAGAWNDQLSGFSSSSTSNPH